MQKRIRMDVFVSQVKKDVENMLLPGFVCIYCNQSCFDTLILPRMKLNETGSCVAYISFQ